MLFYVILLLFILNPVSSIVQNEKDLINVLSGDEKEVVINLDSTIDISNDIIIYNSYEKLSIIGKSVDTSILNFKDISGKLHFAQKVKEIELKNISIIGNIYFDNNKIISISSVSLTGNINSNFDTDNEFIKIENFKYKSSAFQSVNCLDLSGNIEIKNSEFYGSSSCLNRLINFEGLEKYKLSIQDSYFSGEYSCLFINVNKGLNITINGSTFEKGFGNEEVEGGGVIRAYYSYIYLKDCIFKDIISTQKGGAFYLDDILDFKAEKLEIYNTTSLDIGSVAFMMTVEEIESTATFKNIKQFDTGNMKGMKQGGLIMNLEKFANVVIEDYYAENLVNTEHAGCAFILSHFAKLSVRNMMIDTLKGNSIDGLFFFTLDSNDIVFDVYNVTLNNLYQINGRESAILFWTEKNVKLTAEKIKITNSSGVNTRLMYIADKTQAVINDLEVDSFYSESSIELILLNTNKYAVNTIFNRVKISNIISQGPIFKINSSTATIVDSEVKNIHRCNIDGSCKNKETTNLYQQGAELFMLDGDSNVLVKNSIFENAYGVVGIKTVNKSNLEFYNNIINDCYFKDGVFFYDESNRYALNVTIDNSSFTNIRSEKGSVLHIEDMHSGTSNCKFKAINSKFYNNTASKYGGVIYSLSPNTNRYIVIQDCDFKDNKALIGDSIYSLNITSEPNITDIDSLKNIKGFFATNPTRISLNEKSINEISIYSGEKIPSGIICNIYDDYNSLIVFESDVSVIEYDEFMFFSISANDSYNVELLGQSQSYCWGDSCEFPSSLKVIGNPGNYFLRLTINTFGQFSRFNARTVEVPVEIKECDENFINQNVDSTKFKSCYEPKCEQSCGQGKCININLCNCTDTLYTGRFCNENYKFERKKILDFIISTITVAFLILTVVLIFLTFTYRKNPKIKGGSVDFLIIILFGSIFSYIYVFLLTIERTTTRCYMIYLFNNIGFSLVFGSILVKTLRIYRIFNIRRKENLGIKKEVMYAIVICIVLFHVTVIILWTIYDGIKADSAYTSDKKVYQKCFYSKTRTLCVILNYFILIIGFFLSYSIRNVKKDFKENLNIPVYVYVMTMGIIELINLQEDISIEVQDLFGSLGTLLNTSVILYFLYMTKFYDIYIKENINNSQTLSKSKKTNKSQTLNKAKSQALYNSQKIPNPQSLQNIESEISDVSM